MISPTCLKCKKQITADDIHVGRDVAFCRPCNLSYTLSDLTHRDEMDSNIPPAGAWLQKSGMRTVIGATHRSLKDLIFLLPFCLFWNIGILSTVRDFLSGILKQFEIPNPEWLPETDMHSPSMGLGLAIFLCLFFTPFVLAGLWMIVTLLSNLGGRTEVRIEENDGMIFVGIGPLGYRRRFNTASVTGIQIQQAMDEKSQPKIILELPNGKKIKFGSMLTDERRMYVAGTLRKCLKL